MRLTFHGWVAVAVMIVGVANAIAYGPWALNAIVVPVTVGLVVGAVQVWRVLPPRTGRVALGDGFSGETRTVSPNIDVGRLFSATVFDALSPGLDGDTMIDSIAGDSRVDYEMTYRGRGSAMLSPMTIAARDILDLLPKPFTAGGTTETPVFPRVRPPGATARQGLSVLVDAGYTNERAKLNRLREYVPGDPLCDIHWKSSVKSGDLAMKTYDDRVTADAIRALADTMDSHEDAVAEAATALYYALSNTGVLVHLILPAGVVEATSSDRRRILACLSRFRSGPAPDEITEIVVSGDTGKTRVVLDGHEMTFDRLHVEHGTVGGSNRNPASRVETHRPDSGVSA